MPKWNGRPVSRSAGVPVAGGLQTGDGVQLYWLPLGAGDRFPIVRWSGRVFEALAARRTHRARCALFHAALEILAG